MYPAHHARAVTAWSVNHVPDTTSITQTALRDRPRTSCQVQDVIGWRRCLEISDQLGEDRQDLTCEPRTARNTAEGVCSKRNPAAATGCRWGGPSPGQLFALSPVEEHASALRAEFDRDTPTVDRQELSAAGFGALELRNFHLGDVQLLERRVQSIPRGTLFFGLLESAGVDPEPPATVASEEGPLIASPGVHGV